MTRLATFIGAFLLVAAGAALWLAPASWADWALQRASGGTIGLAEPRGQARAGAGRAQAILPTGEAVDLEAVRWDFALRLSPAGVLRLRVFSAASGAALAELGLGTAGLTVDAARVELPAALLGAWAPALRQAALSGRLRVSAKQLGLRQGSMDGEVEVLWNDATSGLVPGGSLGSYRIGMRGDARGGLEGTVATLAGAALAVTGGFRRPAGGALAFDLQAEPAEAHRQRLAALLNILGREIRPGVYQLEADAGIGLGIRRAATE